MALESLPPDQRAVVQLVLQQGRSYSDLAGLLGISDEAVRKRARAGLSLLGADATVSAEDQGQISDYLLGQQDEGEQAASRALLERSAPAREWAEFVAEDLRPVARHGLPEIPAADAAVAESELAHPEPAPAEPEPEPDAEPEVEPEPVLEPAPPEPVAAGEEAAPDPDPVAAGEEAAPDPDPVAAAPALESTRRRRRERPGDAGGGAVPAGTPAARRRERRAARRAAASDVAPIVISDDDPPREASRLGGALILGVVALLAVIAVVYLVNRGDEEPSAANTTSTEASASATATPAPLAQLPLKAANAGSKAEGLVQINATQQGQVSFTLVARNMATTQRGKSAYAIWLVGAKMPPIRLGFGEVLANQGGTLAVQGPEDKLDPATFTRGLTTYKNLVVSRETSSNVTMPRRAVLRGSLASLRGGGAAGN